MTSPRAVPVLSQQPPGGNPFAAAWCRALLIIPLVTAIIYLVLPALPLPPLPPPEQSILPKFLPDCLPERLEQLQYLVALALLPLLYWFALMFDIRARSGRAPAQVPATRFMPRYIFALAAQAALLALVIYELVPKTDKLMRFIWAPVLLLPLLAVLLLLYHFGILAWFVAPFRRLIAHRTSHSRAGQSSGPFAARNVVPLVIACLLTATCLLSAVQTHRSYPRTALMLQHHIPFTFADFAAVYNHRTILVDFMPQYQQLSPYLLYPWFSLVGLSVVSFTWTLAFFSFLGLIFHFHILRRVTGSSALALAFYVPFLALSFMVIRHWVDPGTSPWEYYNTFDYYAAAPLRYFGPWLVAWVLMLLPRRPSFLITFLFLTLAAFVALNNLDFGVPALAAAMLVLLLLGPNAPFPPLKHWLRIALALLLAVGVAGLTFIFGTRLISGTFPHIGYLFAFQRIFAVTGFYMLPLPARGLYVPVFFILIAAIYTALSRAVALRRMPDSEPSDRSFLLTRALLNAGLFGAGAFAYYVGRSHTDVLMLLFPAIGFAFMLLVYAHFSFLRSAFSQLSTPQRAIQVFPTCALAGGYVIAFASLFLLPSPTGQVHRLINPGPDDRVTDARLVDLIRRNTIPGEEVCIIYPYGHLLAQEAGVTNVFPFGQDISLVSYAQLAMFLDQLHRHHVRHYFGSLPDHLVPALTAEGLDYEPLLPADNARYAFGIGTFTKAETTPTAR